MYTTGMYMHRVQLYTVTPACEPKVQTYTIKLLGVLMFYQIKLIQCIIL